MKKISKVLPSLFCLLFLVAFALPGFAHAQASRCKSIVAATNQTASPLTGSAYATGKGIFYAARLVYNNDAGTDPTLDCQLQRSPDGNNYAAVSDLTFAQVTTSAGYADKFLDINSSQLFPYVRAVCTIGGTDAPQYDITIFLCTDSW